MFYFFHCEKNENYLMLSNQEKVIIYGFKNKGFFARQMIEDILGISRVMFTNYIQNLIEKNLI